MYKISANGIFRFAKYEIDNEKKTFKRTYLDIMEDENDKSDVITVVLSDENTNDTLKSIWLLLYGKPRDIVKSIREDYQMAILESNAIFDILDKVDAEETIALTYITSKHSNVIKNTEMYRTLASCQKGIISSMYDIDEKNIYLPEV